MQKHSDASTTVSTAISSFEVEDDIDTVNILISLECEQFSKLRECFFGKRMDLTNDREIMSEDRYPAIFGSLTRNEFIVSMEKIHDYRSGAGIGAAKVFDEIDTTHKGWIKWENFLDYAMAQMGSRETIGSQAIINPKPIFHRINHCKKTGAIAKIISITAAKTTFLMVTIDGFVCAYDSSLEKILGTFTVPLSGTQETSTSGSFSSFASNLPQPSSKMAKPWVTDAVLMEDTNQVVFATSDRSLHFRDVGGRGSPWMFHVTGLRNAPTCLAYYPSQQITSEKSSKSELEKESMQSGTVNDKSEKDSNIRGNSVLLFGDDGGNIWSLKFLQPSESLFHRSRRKGEGAEHIHWLELENNAIVSKTMKDRNTRSKCKVKACMTKALKGNIHEKYVEISVMRNVHANAVSQISFCFGAPHAVVSCSTNDRFSLIKRTSKRNNNGASLVLQARSSQASPYIFRIPSGIRCFDLWEVKERINTCDFFLLATGSTDALIRLWNPYVPQMTIATLVGHVNAIKDLMFTRLGMLLLLFSICYNSEVRLWKASGGEYCCLQVVPLIFPAMGRFGKKTEFGSKVLYIYETHDMNLLITYSNEIAILPFEKIAKISSSLRNTESENRNEKTNDEDKDYTFNVLADDLNAHVKIGHNIYNGIEDDVTLREDLKSDDVMRERIFASAFGKLSKHSEHIQGKNECQSLQERYQKEMKKYVSVCAPHLALPTYPPANITSQPSAKRF